MATLSLCMIVKNESAVLANCLNSVKDVVDEIIIADTGSTDDTKEIARQFTDKIYDFPWIDDFAAARNFSYSKATCDYIIWLDADDIIPPEEAVKLKELKDQLFAVDAVMLRYITGFDADSNPTFSFYRERIAKRANNYQWHEPVHEYLDRSGVVITLDIAVMHTKKERTHSDRNIKIYEKQLSDGKKLSPRGTYYYARELLTHGRHADAIARYREFIDSKQGWVEDILGACEGMSDCYAALGDSERALTALFEAFAFALPRAEHCCKAGYIYKNRGDFKSALFWFKLAATLEKPESWGFIRDEMWDYVPLAECVVCYDKLGDTKSAEEYNEKAAAIRPNSPSVEYNRRYFNSIKKSAAGGHEESEKQE